MSADAEPKRFHYSMLYHCKPIWWLHINGFCCPCLESEGDHLTRVAEISLTTVPIRWYRKITTKSPTGKGKKWFSKTDVVAPCGSPNDTIETSQANQTELSSYVGIDATLDVFDTASGPSIYITSREFNFVDDEDSVHEKNKAYNPAMQKVIRLRDVGEISCGNDMDWKDFGVEDFHECGVVLRGQPGEGGKDATGKKLLIFNVIHGDTAHNSTRNEVVQHLNTLFSWDRKRIATIEDSLSESTYKLLEDGEDDKGTVAAKNVSKQSVKIKE